MTDAPHEWWEDENLCVASYPFGSLKHDGIFVLDVMGKEVLARSFEPTGAREVDGHGLAILRRNVVDDWSRMENEWILVSDNKSRAFRFRHWLYAGSELRAMLGGAGFPTVRLYGDISGNPYGPEARRLVAVARKGGAG